MNCAFYIVQDDCQNANHTNSLPYIEGNSLISLPVLPRVMCHLSRSYWRHYIYLDLSDPSMAGVRLAV